MTAKESKTKPNMTQEQMKQLLEEVVTSKLDSIIATQVAHSNRLEAIEGTLGSIENRVHALELNTRSILSRLSEIEKRMVKVEKRLEKHLMETAA